MSVEAECPHGLGMVEACVLCNSREAEAEKLANTVAYNFLASYDGHLSCGHSVESGDEVARMCNGDLRCKECAP